MYERIGICQGCGQEGLLRDISTKKMSGILTLCEVCRKPRNVVPLRVLFMSDGKAAVEEQLVQQVIDQAAPDVHQGSAE